jgi:hypothetical protein
MWPMTPAGADAQALIAITQQIQANPANDEPGAVFLEIMRVTLCTKEASLLTSADFKINFRLGTAHLTE